MPYQNNNNRLVPKAVGLTSITPQAQIVDTNVKVQANLSEAANFINTANALAALGKGVVDADKMMQRNAQENAIEYIMEDDIVGNNQHLWAEASKRIKGFARLNPYIKDSYQSLAGKEIANKFIYDLAALPNAEKLNQADYTSIVRDKQAELLATLRNNGISSRHAQGAISLFQSNVNNLLGKQQIANNEYTYTMAVNKLQETLLTGATQAFYNNEGAARQAAFEENLKYYYEQAQSLGIPIDDIYKKGLKPLLDNLTERLVLDDNLSQSIDDVIETVKGFNIDGMTMETFNPNWTFDLREKYKNLSMQKTKEMLEDYNIQQKKQAINEDKAMDELGQFIVENPDADNNTLTEKIAELATKYEDGSLIFNLTSRINTYQNAQLKMNKEPMEDALYNEFIAKAYTGALSKEELFSLTGDMSSNQFASLLNVITHGEERQERTLKKEAEQNLKAENAKEKEASKQLKTYTSKLYKVLDNKLPDANNIKGKLGKLKYETDFKEALTSTILSAENGTITYQEAMNRINKLVEDVNTKYGRYEQAIKAQEGVRSNDFKPIDILSLEKRKKMNMPLLQEYNDKQAIKAITAMGIVDNKTPITITSTMQKQRKFDNRPHQAYDLGLKEGTMLRLPKGIRYGRVVAAGFHKDLGNYSLIQLGKNGEYGFIRLAHLKSSPKAGTELGLKAVMGVVGNTGLSTGSHLDIEFWNRNGRARMLAKDFLRQIQGNQAQDEKAMRGFNS